MDNRSFTLMPRAFSRQLNEAVRHDHMTLNKLITSRLPLCLPPHTQTPLHYIQGMIAFGRIYEVFEVQLAEALAGQRIEDRVLNSLQCLDMRKLRRAERIQRDINELRMRMPQEDNSESPNICIAIDDLFDTLSDSLSQRPHLILAYAWAMYLALFNGGGWIHQHLRDAGDDFWRGPASLSFWEFDGHRDGDDVHEQFKQDFERAAGQLSCDEWEDVVREAKKNFALCSDLVTILDGNTGKNVAVGRHVGSKQPSGIKKRFWTAFGYACAVYILSLTWQLFPKSLLPLENRGASGGPAG